MIFLPAALYVALATQPLPYAHGFTDIYFLRQNLVPLPLATYVIRADGKTYFESGRPQNFTAPAPAAPAAPEERK